MVKDALDIGHGKGRRNTGNYYHNVGKDLTILPTVGNLTLILLQDRDLHRGSSFHCEDDEGKRLRRKKGK